MELNKIYNVDNRIGLKNLPDESVDCCVTSPPYFGLRDYGVDGQIGLEDTPEAFVAQMVDVFTEVKRVLKKDGTLWLNLGDSYNGSGKAGSNPEYQKKHTAFGRLEEKERFGKPTMLKGLKPKDLIGIPWMVAFALRSAGWYLRQDIIWHKPNPMPESVTDRCTKSHEYIFLLSKSGKYFYDNEAIKVPTTNPELIGKRQRVDYRPEGTMKVATGKEKPIERSEDANKRSVWTVTTKPYKESHFATFPEDLIVDMIKAGCPEEVCTKCGKARERIIERQAGVSVECPKTQTAHEARGGVGKPSGTVGKSGSGRINPITIEKGFTDCGCNAGFTSGIVLDPFMGAGTTALVAAKLNRNFVGFELNPDYVAIAEKRLRNELGMFYPKSA